MILKKANLAKAKGAKLRD